jgi:vacuolar-type H+-ATPase subunit E/Vma4
MEEMVSTEALENEILEDARKKGERLLKDAETEAAKIRADSGERTQGSLASVTADYTARAERYRAENLARLPLEKCRLKATFVDRLLRSAAESYLSSLSKERIALLVSSRLGLSSPLVGSAEVSVRFKGISEKEARGIMASALPSARVATILPDETLLASGLAVETASGMLRIAATLDLVGEELLDEHRGELGRALCAEALAL